MPKGGYDDQITWHMSRSAIAFVAFIANLLKASWLGEPNLCDLRGWARANELWERRAWGRMHQKKENRA